MDLPKMKIIIPARYASTRLPGKPLLPILGIPMIKRVWNTAISVSNRYDNVSVVIATDDDRIAKYCDDNQMRYVMTSINCPNGTVRCLQAIDNLIEKPDFIINLQGDNPLCPPWFIDKMIEQYISKNNIEVISPYVNLGWVALDDFRAHKNTLPFSGTTVITDKNDRAVWFSKQIIPAIRNEDKLKLQTKISPVKRHIGLYGYTYQTLQKIINLPTSSYGDLEGLEQLAFLEAGIDMQMYQVDYKGRKGMSGVDSPEDISVAEDIFRTYGEFS